MAARYALVIPLAIGDETLGSVAFETEAEPASELLPALAVIGELFASAMKRRRAEALLSEQLRFEEAMTEAASRLLDAAHNVADGAVEHALSSIGRALQFDRITVLELNAERSVFTARVEWRAQGIVRFADDRPAVPIDAFGWPLTELRDGRALAFTPEQLPAEALAAQYVMERDRTRLLVTVPLIVAGAVVGCVAFHRIQSGRQLTQHQHARLQLAGSMLAAALARTSAAQSLSRSEARFAQVVASALDAFSLVNGAGVIVEWTPRAERLFGRSRGQALGSDFVKTVLAGDSRELHELHAAAQRHADGRIEIMGRRGDQQELPLELSITRLGGGDDDLFAVFIRDITERKHAEQARQRAFDEVARRSGSGSSASATICARSCATAARATSSSARARRSSRCSSWSTAWRAPPRRCCCAARRGVGKELVARAIHARSRARERAAREGELRARSRAELFESEFFGHVKGAFTGAHQATASGRFELADGGTLFLDEVGEIPLELQAKLLRVLQEREFERVGGDAHAQGRRARRRRDQPRPRGGRGRRAVPRGPLLPAQRVPDRGAAAARARRDDIVLAGRALPAPATRRELGAPRLVARRRDATTLLARYDWPGNVRELRERHRARGRACRGAAAAVRFLTPPGAARRQPAAGASCDDSPSCPGRSSAKIVLALKRAGEGGSRSPAAPPSSSASALDAAGSDEGVRD